MKNGGRQCDKSKVRFAAEFHASEAVNAIQMDIDRADALTTPNKCGSTSIKTTAAPKPVTVCTVPAAAAVIATISRIIRSLPPKKLSAVYTADSLAYLFLFAKIRFLDCFVFQKLRAGTPEKPAGSK